MARRGSRISLTATGTREISRRLHALGDAATSDLRRALYAHAEDVISESKGYVPVMDGILRASAYVRAGIGAVVTLGFSAPYARRVHENPRAGRTGGVSPSGRPYKKWAQVGVWKFLERPLRASERTFQRTVAAVIRAVWAQRLGR